MSWRGDRDTIVEVACVDHEHRRSSHHTYPLPRAFTDLRAHATSVQNANSVLSHGLPPVPGMETHLVRIKRASGREIFKPLRMFLPRRRTA